MQKQLQDIYTILKGSNTLKTYLGGTSTDSKIYPAIADKFENFPCLTYAVIDSSHRTVPHNIQDITLQFDIFVRNDRALIENIYTTVNNLLNYYQDTNRLVYVKQILERDSNETDRQLYRKTIRYQLWTRDI